MPDTILFQPVPLDKRQVDQVNSAISHEGYQLLKEVITAQAIRLQVDAMNAKIYANTNEGAASAAEQRAQGAARYAIALDVLDEMEKKQDQWFKAELKAGR